ncbi:MAG TPA: hypothetical protein VKD91_07655, partial [Pyrinomonadaceae bacterium]|nr:hypothetical protein [Pyrinomonadaceae bacterium]
SLTLLCYQTRLSRILPLDTTGHSLIGSIKMAHERNTSSVQLEDTEDNQFEHAPGVVTGSQVQSPILPPPSALFDLHLDLIAYSSYRRPPPACQ